jgi:hypothetical protein
MTMNQDQERSQAWIVDVSDAVPAVAPGPSTWETQHVVSADSTTGDSPADESTETNPSTTDTSGDDPARTGSPADARTDAGSAEVDSAGADDESARDGTATAVSAQASTPGASADDLVLFTAAAVSFGALFVLAVRWVHNRVSLKDTPLRTLALHGTVAGCATGVAFLLGLFAVALVPTLQGGGIRLRAVLLVLLIGAGFAAVVGGVVGLLASLLDTAVYRLAGYLLPEAENERVTEPRRQ